MGKIRNFGTDIDHNNSYCMGDKQTVKGMW